jgi:arylsulfatase A-like enzyme
MSKKPNILVIITDDTDFSMMRWSGGRVLSPAIDSIADEGLQCRQFYVNAAVCTPGRYCYLTGHHAGRCPGPQFNAEFGPDEPHCIQWNTDLDPSRERSLGHVLQSAGYRTGHVGKWHVGPGKGKLGIDQFEGDENPYDPAIITRLKADHERCCQAVRDAGYDYADAVTWGNADDRRIRTLQFHNLEWMCQGALTFLEQSATTDQPFYLNIATSTMHGPSHDLSLEEDIRLTGIGPVHGLDQVMAPRASIFERLQAAGLPVDHRTTGILWTDDLVAALLQKLQDLGLERDTLVIFSTDHNAFDGKASCYQGGVHVPFCLRWPDHIAAGTVNDSLMQNVDLLPTLAAISGAALPEQPIDGHNLTPQWLEGNLVAETREDVFLDYGYQRGITDGCYKFISFRLPQDQLEKMKNDEVDQAFGLTGKPGGQLVARRYPHYWEPDQLYDLSIDPGEQHNRIDDPRYVEIRERLHKRLWQHLASFSRPFPLDEIDPFYHSDRYRELCQEAMRRFQPEQWEWYAKGWY